MKRLYYEPYNIKDDEAGCSDQSNDFVHAVTQSDDEFIVSDNEPLPDLEESSEEVPINSDFSTESLDENPNMRITGIEKNQILKVSLLILFQIQCLRLVILNLLIQRKSLFQLKVN